MFIIQASPRTGSHMLQTALNKHSELVCYGEIFNVQDNRHLPIDITGLTTAEVLRGLQEFNKYNFGFVAHSFTGYNPNNQGKQKKVWANYGDLWEILPKNIPMIWLRRHDIISQVISMQRALRTNQWVLFKNGKVPIDKLKITIRKEEVLGVIAELKRWDNFIASFGFVNILYVYYEDLVNDWQKTITKILSFLQSPYQELVTSTIKTGDSLDNMVENYQQLKASMSDTEYAKWFI